jgi:hypothetical protein
MARWDYKTTMMDLNKIIPPAEIACNSAGTCKVDSLPELPDFGLDRVKKILDDEGTHEWELVQCQLHGGKMLCIWKREVKEAFAS